MVLLGCGFWLAVSSQTGTFNISICQYANVLTLLMWICMFSKMKSNEILQALLFLFSPLLYLYPPLSFHLKSTLALLIMSKATQFLFSTSDSLLLKLMHSKEFFSVKWEMMMKIMSLQVQSDNVYPPHPTLQLNLCRAGRIRLSKIQPSTITLSWAGGLSCRVGTTQ